jgi:hypothetical protein
MQLQEKAIKLAMVSAMLMFLLANLPVLAELMVLKG